MNFSYNFIQEFVNKKIPKAGKVAEVLTMHSFEVEGVEKAGKDWILDIDILPNRAHDAASHRGVARELAAIMSLGHAGDEFKKAKPKSFEKFNFDKYKNKEGSLSIKIKDKQACRRYLGVVVEGVKVKESPKWLKERLEALGLNSINNVVDAANYAMLATGQPLHAFDVDKISGDKIIVRGAKEGEKIITLDNEEYEMSGNDLVIADAEKPLAIAGIKGGKNAEVGKETSRIFLESAWFDPISIRMSSDSLGLRTDASWRFEHETPISFPEQGLAYVLDLLKKTAGGSVSYAVEDGAGKKDVSKKISLRSEYVESILGIDVSPTKISAMLKSIDFKVENKDKNLSVTVPGFRPDIKIEEDLVEEVGRMFGYENIEPKMPIVTLYPPKRNIENYWLRQIRSNLAANGFNEIYSYSFVSEKIAKEWGFSFDKLWELRNPASEDFKYMKPSLLPNIVISAKENLKFFESVEIFEIGDVFERPFVDTEQKRLALCLAAKNDKEIFYELKGQVESFLNSLGISDVWFDDALTKKEKKELGYLHPFRRAQIKIGRSTVGFMGQISQKIASSEKIKGTIIVADLNLEKIISDAEEESIYSPVSTYPQSTRDVSVLVPVDVKTIDIMNAINSVAGKLLRDVDMFDYYEEQGSDKKSMAFHLIFQAKNRTLNSKEIDEIMARVEKEIEKNEWEVK